MFFKVIFLINNYHLIYKSTFLAIHKILSKASLSGSFFKCTYFIQHRMPLYFFAIFPVKVLLRFCFLHNKK
uniref:Uncharacterized protein n=1 Tax=Anguilla anguilla TaxID=7936 RepID=A0A0E9S4F7_ANGAN